MYKDAIANTWSVEEIDFSTDLHDLRERLEPGRAPPDPPPRRVLRDRRHDRGEQPRAQPLQAHQRARSADVPLAPALRRSAAHPVLPDAARCVRARRPRADAGVRGDRQHPVDQSEGEFCFKWIGSIDSLDRIETQRRPPRLSAEPHHVRGGDRRAVLFRRLRLRVFPALARRAQRPRLGNQLGVPRREHAHELRVHADRHDPLRTPGTVRRSDLEASVRADARRRRRLRARISPPTCSPKASPASRSAT